MDIRKLLFAVAIRFENFYQKWMTDDESFDPTWMSLDKWKATKAR